MGIHIQHFPKAHIQTSTARLDSVPQHIMEMSTSFLLVHVVAYILDDLKSICDFTEHLLASALFFFFFQTSKFLKPLSSLASHFWQILLPFKS